MEISESIVFSALGDLKVSRDDVESLPQDTRRAVTAMIDAYGRGNDNAGWSIYCAEQEKLSTGHDGPQQSYDACCSQIMLARIQKICIKLLFLQRTFPYPFEPSQN